MKSVSLGLTWSCRWYMICDKVVMSRPQVAPPPSPRPCPFSVCVKWQLCKSGSQKTFISPHLCGLRRDDLGVQPSKPSCHLQKKKKGGGQQDGETREIERERWQQLWSEFYSKQAAFLCHLEPYIFFVALHQTKSQFTTRSRVWHYSFTQNWQHSWWQKKKKTQNHYVKWSKAVNSKNLLVTTT